jgi:hypothetical protein
MNGENTVIGRKIDVTKLMYRYNNIWYDGIGLDISTSNSVYQNGHGDLVIHINAMNFK